ncbi:MAG: tRNA pseudouridine(38-40) synthase TruA [Bacilli bacterium]|nr:tRNA pseudouridine(38-40) synthase TruA [Bacilli bacterium]
MRYLVKIAYDGSKFYGFQRLNDLLTVQKEIENSLKKVFKQDILIKGAGRTDKGVHALEQAFHFDVDYEMKLDSLKKAIQRYVSDYILIKSCHYVDESFHARFSVKKKVYVYKINLGEASPLKEDYYLQPKFAIDIKKLRKVSKLFIGQYDFKNFVSGEHNNTISVIYDIKIKKEKEILSIIFVGKAFYKYMVRNLVGAMLDYNKNKVTLEGIAKMLKKPNVTRQLSTAPSNGLYLEKIFY